MVLFRFLQHICISHCKKNRTRQDGNPPILTLVKKHPLLTTISQTLQMVFTHLPSAIFLLLLPFPSQLGGAITLLVLRSTLASMDQAPRSAFLAAVVLPEERTSVMGIVNVAKTLSQSAGPLVTGLLAAGGKFWIAFVVAGALKAR